MTYRTGLTNAVNVLEEAHFPDASSDAWILFEYVTGLNRMRYYMDSEKEMPESEEALLGALLTKRLTHIPIQHLTHAQVFMGYSFFVNESVLVPRQDTENLVLEAEKFLKLHPEASVLDVCTGSGCIPISLKLRNPKISVDAVDLSEEALAVARKNSENLGAFCTYIHSDMFSKVSKTYDLITSNPPYIRTEEIAKLDEEVKLHDPWMALDGKEDGLYFYRILAKESVKHLNKGGFLVMEIGFDQSEAVEKLLSLEGFKNIKTTKDLAGLDRVVSGQVQ